MALLFIGAGALPAMLLVGRVVDRLGVRLTAAAALTAQGVSGLVIAVGAMDFTTLCLGLLLVGAASGAADVAINAAAGAAEQAAARPVITRSHGMFSAFVVVSSLGTGLSATLGATVVFSFAVVGVASVLVALFLLLALPLQSPSGAAAGAGPGVREAGAELKDRDSNSAGATVAVLPVLLLGALGALAFAGENAHQSWSAVFFEDELRTGPGLSSTAPAVFATVVAITRFSVGAVRATQARGVLIIGAAGATLGAAILAIATTTSIAWIGLAVSAAGTAVLYPTLLGMLSRSTREEARGRATSLLATVSYLGFLLGPAYVGLWSEAAGLRGAMLAVAGLCAALLALTPVLLPIFQRLSASTSIPSSGNQEESIKRRP